MRSIQASKTSVDFYKKSCPKCSSIQMENGTKLWVYIPMSELLYLLCGCGSSWFVFTCSSLLVTWAWCFFAVPHMLSFNCKFLWWFFVVLHMLFFTCYMGMVLLCSSSHALLQLLNFCGGSLWFFTCSSLLVTWTWCFFAVLHMLSFNCTWVWWFFVVLHMLSFNCTWVWLFLWLLVVLHMLYFFFMYNTWVWFFVVLHMVFFTCTWGLVLVVLHMLFFFFFFTCT
jgi:hypothetical protein